MISNMYRYKFPDRWLKVSSCRIIFPGSCRPGLIQITHSGSELCWLPVLPKGRKDGDKDIGFPGDKGVMSLESSIFRIAPRNCWPGFNRRIRFYSLLRSIPVSCLAVPCCSCHPLFTTQRGKTCIVALQWAPRWFLDVLVCFGIAIWHPRFGSWTESWTVWQCGKQKDPDQALSMNFMDLPGKSS